MAITKHYAIRGGVEGRERLRILARVMHATTSALFDKLNVVGDLTCLDMGCGGGDVTQELARRAAPNGRAVGADIDDVKLDIARAEANQLGLTNIEYRKADEDGSLGENEFDVVYARFLLTHLSDPFEVAKSFLKYAKPGGRVIIEDIDVSGCFTYPEFDPFSRFHELYCAAVRARGGDPDIGKRLPLLMKEAGLENIGMSIVQPIGIEGEVKLINPLTMENISDAVLELGLATHEEIFDTVRQLYKFAEDPNTIAGLPRVVQTWGTVPVQ